MHTNSSLLQVAFPYLYNNRPRKVRLGTYHLPMVMYIKMEDPDLPAFYYDPLIHPVPPVARDAKRSQWELEDEELLGAEGEGSQPFSLPDGLDPFLAGHDVHTPNTAAGIALLWAPRPFSLRSGRTRRSVDVPLINNWFHEHCPQVRPPCMHCLMCMHAWHLCLHVIGAWSILNICLKCAYVQDSAIKLHDHRS